MKTNPILFLICICLSPLTHAEIFHCTGSNGSTVYKDEPCNKNETLEKVIAPSELEKTTNFFKQEVIDSKFNTNNLLKNSDFENQLSSWHVDDKVLWSDNGGKSESAAVIIQSDSRPDKTYIYRATASQCIPLTGGEEYYLSADFKTDTPFLSGTHTSNRVEVTWWESLDCKKNGQFANSTWVENVLDWQQIEIKRMKPKLNARAAEITLVQHRGDSPGNKVYWDNIVFNATHYIERLTPATNQYKRVAVTLPAGENYLKNGSFNNGLAGWTLEGDPVWNPDIGYKSPGSIYVSASSNVKNKWEGSNPVTQCVNFGIHTRGEIGVSSLTDPNANKNGRRSLRITWYEFENCAGRSKVDNNLAVVDEGLGWQHLKLDNLEIPENSASVSIAIRHSVKDIGIYAAYWDDIYFIGF